MARAAMDSSRSGAVYTFRFLGPGGKLHPRIYGAVRNASRSRVGMGGLVVVIARMSIRVVSELALDLPAGLPPHGGPGSDFE